MDIEDFLKNKNKHQQKYRKHNYHPDQQYAPSGQFNLLKIINGIKNNRKLRNIILIGIVLILVIIIGLIVILFPLIIKLFNFITENGISGLIEVGTEFLNKIWEGTK